MNEQHTVGLFNLEPLDSAARSFMICSRTQCLYRLAEAYWQAPWPNRKPQPCSQ
jgi:hypothetical protein